MKQTKFLIKTDHEAIVGEIHKVDRDFLEINAQQRFVICVNKKYLMEAIDKLSTTSNTDLVLFELTRKKDKGMKLLAIKTRMCRHTVVVSEVQINEKERVLEGDSL